ncbi:hypothetical protein [Aureibacillus halotolerans]|uniref:PHP domain-containing protein n=1 Tax=Aureibacillus halotolerans TaxID=1508390 RepID=A0A4R6U8U7_9BACI|nr:hypothetical protein [Aureibacillus halotolerans]TDQ41229.1 hypothetical protein EV213_104227 [Aureibacillus halotolerans]
MVRGNGITAIGGSDTHRPDPNVEHGTPTTWVLAKARTVESILEAIRKGWVCISSTLEGPRIAIQKGHASVGVKKGKPQVAVSGAKAGQVVKLFSEKGVEERYVIPESVDNWSSDVRVAAAHFYRVELWSEGEGLLLNFLTTSVEYFSLTLMDTSAIFSSCFLYT